VITLQLKLLKAATIHGLSSQQLLNTPTIESRATKKYACKRKNVKYKHKIRPTGSNRKKAVGLRNECKK